MSRCCLPPRISKLQAVWGFEICYMRGSIRIAVKEGSNPEPRLTEVEVVMLCRGAVQYSPLPLSCFSFMRTFQTHELWRSFESVI